MLSPNPCIFVVCRAAMERYFREEGISAEYRTYLTPTEDGLFVSVRETMRAVWRLLTTLSLIRQPRGAKQGVAAV